MGAEIKLLQDFLAAVANDGIRAEHYTSSMADRTPAFLIPGVSSIQEYLVQHKDRVRLLQLLVENEITRLAVWTNPVNEHGRTSAPAVGSLERSTSAVRNLLLSPTYYLSDRLAGRLDSLVANGLEAQSGPCSPNGRKI